MHRNQWTRKAIQGKARQGKARQGKARQGKASVRSTDTCSQGKATMGTRPNLRWSTSGHVTSARVAPCCAETEESDSRRARLANRPDFVTPARNRLHAARVSPARRQCRFRQGSDTAPHTHASGDRSPVPTCRFRQGDRSGGSFQARRWPRRSRVSAQQDCRPDTDRGDRECGRNPPEPRAPARCGTPLLRQLAY